MRTRLLKAVAASVVLSVAACGDSTAPNVNLSDEQIAEMMEALANAGLFGVTPPPVGGGSMAIVTLNESVECPNGGTASVSATINDNETNGSIAISITQGFTNCKATSSAGRMWTFNGNPNIVTTFNGTSNEQTGAFTLNGSQTGGILVSSDLGSGACAFDVTYAMSGNDNTGAFQGSVTGTICGKDFSQSLTIDN